MRREWLYIHSNFTKPHADSPTKIAVKGKVSLFLLLYNLVSWGELNEQALRELMLAHQTKVKYFVNRHKLKKGDADFFSGACNIEFVVPPPCPS